MFHVERVQLISQILRLMSMALMMALGIVPRESLVSASTSRDVSSLSVPSNETISKVDSRVVQTLQSTGQANVIVSLRDPVSTQTPLALRATAVSASQVFVLSGLSPNDFRVTHRYTYVPALAGSISATGLVKLQSNPQIVRIYPNEVIHAALAESVPAIGAGSVHGSYGFSGQGVRVAILDTGVDADHQDLQDDIFHQRCYNQNADCPPFYTTVSDNADDQHGHGTNVTGIITSSGAVSPIGFAPEAEIAAIRVLDHKGDGETADMIAGLEWILNNQSRHAMLHIDIINMSIVSETLFPENCDDAQQDMATAIHLLVNNPNFADRVVIFASSGNRGALNALSFPACLSNVIAVGATYDGDLGRQPDDREKWDGAYCHDDTTSPQTITCFTNSSPLLDIVAPGAWITSSGIGGGTSRLWGTSQASPTAAGVAALMLEANPNLTSIQIEDILKRTGTQATDNQNQRHAPLIDALKAVQSVVESRPLPPQCNPDAAIIRASVSSNGTEANQSSSFYDSTTILSHDGRFVTFISNATNLVTNDTNGVRDIFVHDRDTCLKTRVSVASDGTQANGESGSPVISSDGRFVAFWSDADNLVRDDTNGFRDIFVHDMQTGQTTRVSVASDGTQGNWVAGGGEPPSISADGQYVAFPSWASNLVPNDTNDCGQGGMPGMCPDVFVHDRQTGQTIRVSVNDAGVEGNAASFSPSISANGLYVAFGSSATNLVSGDNNNVPDIFVYDINSKTISRVSIATNGNEANGSSGPWPPFISGNGRFVAFVTNAFNFDDRDTNTCGGWVVPGSCPDIYMRDLQLNQTYPVSTTNGVPTGLADGPTLSFDGRYMTINRGAYYNFAYIRDLQTGQTIRVIDDYSSTIIASISPDGNYVAFHSDANSLVLGDNNGQSDIFVVKVSFPSPSPPNAAPSRNYLTTSTPTFTWSRVTWAIRYELQLANNQGFYGATLYDVGNNLSFTVPSPLTNGTYYWRLRACPANGSCGAWSASDSFVIDVP